METYLQIYTATEDGKIINKSTGKVLKTYTLNSGYQAVKLHNNGDRKGFLVHRLVAYSHCEGYSEELSVNHKDGNRLNNHKDNLEWVTTKENIHDMMARGAMNYHKAQQVAKEKNKRPIISTDVKTGEEKEWSSILEAKQANGTFINIVRAIQHGYTCGGRKWRYKE